MELSAENGAPNAIGRKYARRYAARKNELLKLASWDGADLFTPLFLAQPIVLSRIDAFGRTLKEGERIRQKVTLANFPTVLREMTPFFDPAKPIRAVRAFYSMLYAWTERSTVQISAKAPDQATLGGETITNLIPAKRILF
jgi:hypothetical protein